MSTHHRVSILFFFQAEDGIRDGHVTGVQTCALPICGAEGGGLSIREPADAIRAGIGMVPEDRKQDGLLLAQSVRVNTTLATRSEERRVGKECRARWATDHEEENEWRMRIEA